MGKKLQIQSSIKVLFIEAHYAIVFGCQAHNVPILNIFFKNVS